MSKFSNHVRNFMRGRYGIDRLNMVLLYAGLILCIISMFLWFPLVRLSLTLTSYILMGIAVFRCLSRNTYRRYLENRKFLMFFQNLRDRQHRYYDCPRCRQQIRVPRGKGKINIRCPKCKESFIKKT